METAYAYETGIAVKAVPPAEAPATRPILSAEEAEAVARCASGDLSGYRWIYDRYSQPLLRTALRFLGRREEAEDAVQDTFLKLHRFIGNFKTGSAFSTYLFRILINSCKDILRRRGSVYPESASDMEIPIRSGHEERHALEEAVAALPNRMKTCFLLCAVEEFSYEETAAMLGIHIGTVKTSVHRARQKLREWLAMTPSLPGDES